MEEGAAVAAEVAGKGALGGDEAAKAMGHGRIGDCDRVELAGDRLQWVEDKTMDG